MYRHDHMHAHLYNLQPFLNILFERVFLKSFVTFSISRDICKENHEGGACLAVTALFNTIKASVQDAKCMAE